MENQTIFVRFLRTHPAFGLFVGQIGEVLKEAGEQLIADGFAEPAPAPEAAPELAIVPAEEAPEVEAAEASKPATATDETR